MENTASVLLIESWRAWLEATMSAAPPALESTLRSVNSDLGSPDAAGASAWFRFDGRHSPRLFAAVEEVLSDLLAEPDAAIRELLAIAWDLVVADRLEEGHLLPGERLPIPAPAAAGFLTRRGLARLARRIGADDPTWTVLDARAGLRAEALAAFADDLAPGDIAAWRERTIGRWATGAVVGAAAAGLAGRPELALELARALDAIHVAEEAANSVIRLRSDGLSGRLSPLARLCAAEAGLEVSPIVGVDALLGLVAMSATLRSALARARAGLAEARPSVAALPRTCARVDAAEAALVSLETLLGAGIDLGSARPSGDTPPRRLPDRASALARGDAALAADPLAREALEIHSWGAFGAPLATASRFPRALLAGLAGERGRGDPAAARALILDWRARDYGYFEEPNPLPPDIDTLGTLARFFPWVADDPACREVFDAPLEWLEANLSADGSPTVFLLEGWTDAAAWRARHGGLLGTGCLGCQLHLIEGLLELPHPRAAALLPRVLAGALARLGRSGLGELIYYRASWATMVLARLAGRLEEHADPAFAAAGERFGASVANLLPRLLLAKPTLAIDLACLRIALGPQPSVLGDALAARLLSMQRPDGLWEADPLYIIPRPGSSTWHRSRLLTTAVVLRALDEAAP